MMEGLTVSITALDFFVPFLKSIINIEEYFSNILAWSTYPVIALHTPKFWWQLMVSATGYCCSLTLIMLELIGGQQ